MDSIMFFGLGVIFIVFPPEVTTTKITDKENIVVATNDDFNETMILHECQNSDYRTYIKCLKRHKRHHPRHENNDEGDTTRCFNDCGMEQCETTKCVHDCHRRCMKTTKETRQVITSTQYETACVTGDCDEKTKNRDTPTTTNVTTNIDVNNVINNHIPSRESEGGNWPGFYLTPQIQLVPQITFGIGFPFGGFPPIVHHPVGGVDCSPCGNPLLRYRCDVTCYPGSAGTIGGQDRSAGRVSPDCVVPHCVGGA